VEFIVELFLELIFEAFALIIVEVIHVVGKVKVPFSMRLIIFTVICAIPVFISVLGGFSIKATNGIVGAFICWIVGFVCILLWVFGYYRIFKTKN